MAQKEDVGGGTMALLRGKVFEKAGVSISKVFGQFSKEFCAQIPGAEGPVAVAGSGHSARTAEQSGPNKYVSGDFWAAGISMVVHPAHPRVPAIHMNTRHIVTSHGWFGGGGDLNPVFPDERDTADFHGALKAACDRFDAGFYPRYKKWCDEYFFIPHRNKPRGVGGIFYDNHDTGDWDRDFAFTKAVGEAVLEIYPQIVRRHMNTPFTAEERAQQLVWRGHYAEFNLVYDRGTKFGLATGGNTEAILMSLPPEAKWP
jgi:coproporphyrinogen III oxidase